MKERYIKKWTKAISKCLIISISVGFVSNFTPINYCVANAAEISSYFDNYNGTTRQEFVKRKFLNAVNNLDYRVYFSKEEMLKYSLKKSDLAQYYSDVLFEHPEIFYVANYTFIEDDKKGGYDVYIGYTCSTEKIPEMKTELQKKIDEILNKISSYDGIGKIYAIYDYIRVNNSYDIKHEKVDFDFNNCHSEYERALSMASYSEYFESHSVYGTLINGQSVWEGYSKTLMLLLRAIGYKAGIIRVGDHGFNYVIINGLYYHLRFNYEESDYEYYSNPYKYLNFSYKYISLEQYRLNKQDDTYYDNTYDNIFRKYDGGKIAANNVVRIKNKLYYLDSEYKIYSYELNGINKKFVYNLRLNDKNVIKYMKAYENYLYYISYEYVGNKYVAFIKRYNVDTGKVEKVMDLNSVYNMVLDVQYVDVLNFYIKNGVIYINFKGTVKNYELNKLSISNDNFGILYEEALEYVKKFEKKLTYSSYKKAKDMVNELNQSDDKDDLLDRIKAAKKKMDRKNEDDDDDDESEAKEVYNYSELKLPIETKLSDVQAPSAQGIQYRAYNTSNDKASNRIILRNDILPGQWLFVDGSWRHMNDQLQFTTGWLKYNGSMYYFDSDGSMATGWRQIGDDMYYFDDGGAMETGWIKDDSTGKWYYLQDNGAMIKDTVKCGYLFGKDGAWIKK